MPLLSLSLSPSLSFSLSPFPSLVLSPSLLPFLFASTCAYHSPHSPLPLFRFSSVDRPSGHPALGYKWCSHLVLAVDWCCPAHSKPLQKLSQGMGIFLIYQWPVQRRTIHPPELRPLQASCSVFHLLPSSAVPQVLFPNLQHPPRTSTRSCSQSP